MSLKYNIFFDQVAPGKLADNVAAKVHPILRGPLALELETDLAQVLQTRLQEALPDALMPDLKARIKAELRGTPRKIGSYLRYDLIGYDKHIFALPQQLGPVDLTADGVPAPGSGILVGHSRRELKLRIAICRLLFSFRRADRS